MKFYLILALALFFSFNSYACPKTSVKQKIAIFSAGPSAVGKTTILKKLSECFTNSIFLERSDNDTKLDSDFSKYIETKDPHILIFDGDFTMGPKVQKWIKSPKVKTHAFLFIAGEDVLIKRMTERGVKNDQKSIDASPVEKGTAIIKKMDSYRTLLRDNPQILQVNTEIKIETNVSKLFKIITATE